MAEFDELKQQVKELLRELAAKPTASAELATALKEALTQIIPSVRSRPRSCARGQPARFGRVGDTPPSKGRSWGHSRLKEALFEGSAERERPQGDFAPGVREGRTSCPLGYV